jgi:pyrroloquinoline quinone (PQQ) biosynthesis protein C
VVEVTRERYSDFYQLKTEDGHVEELEIDDVLKWFDERGADMYAVQKAMDYVWNFLAGTIEIKNPKEPKSSIDSRYSPKLT